MGTQTPLISSVLSAAVFGFLAGPAASLAVAPEPATPVVQDAEDALTEKSLRQQFRAAYASPKEEARAEAVATLGSASRSLSDGGSSKLMAKTLAGALDDKSMAVQSAAVAALTYGRHVETAIDVLGDYLHELKKLSEKLGTRPDEESRDTRNQAGRLFTQVCVALGRHPDDRSMEALADQLVKLRPRMGASSTSELFVRPLAAALLELGSQKSVEHVISTVGVFSGNALTNGVSAGTARSLHDALTAFSEELGYGATAFRETYDVDWRNWFKKHEDELPTKLGKLKDPISAPMRMPNSMNRRRPGTRERP